MQATAVSDQLLVLPRTLFSPAASIYNNQHSNEAKKSQL